MTKFKVTAQGEFVAEIIAETEQDAIDRGKLVNSNADAAEALASSTCEGAL